MNMTYYEKFKLISEQKTEKEMLAVLYKVGDASMKQLLSYTFDDNVVWLLPEGDPPYKETNENPQDMVHRLAQEMRRLHIFVNVGPYPDMKDLKRQGLFIDLLESLHADDAKLLLSIKNRKLPFPKLNRKFFEKAYPNLKDKWAKK